MTRAASRIAVLTLGALLIAPAPPATAALELVASLPPQAWLVEAIGGARVEVHELVGPGDSPATYQPTDAQVSRVLAAKGLFLVGAPFERGPWFRAVRAAAALEVVDLRDGVELLGTRHGQRRTSEPGLDPHIWLSPRRLVVQARSVAAALRRLDPAGGDVYERNLERTESLLGDLDRELAAALWPFSGRAFLVFHPSWGYFACDYDLRQIAIEEGGKEPADHELTRLARLARDENIRTVFVQPQIRGRAAEAVAAAIGAEVVTLDPLARDVPSNLRAVARHLVASFGP